MKTDRNYFLLLVGQFLGAFGDNFLLAAILSPLTFQLLAGQIAEQQLGLHNALFSAVFFIPFILLAPLAGFLNDRMPKTAWLAGGNLLKLFGTLLGFAGVWLQTRGLADAHLWQIAGYAVVGLGACLYSPAKYGVLPEILPAPRLVKANGTVEMLTLVAILGGLWGGAALYDRTRSLPLCYLAAALLYLGALAFNGLMQRTPANSAASLRHSGREFLQSLRTLLRHPRLGRVLLGCGMFWFAGAALRGNLQGWGLDALQAAGVIDITNGKLALLKVGLIAGIVLGSLLAGQWHRTGDLRWSRRYGLALAAGVLSLGLVGGTHGLALAVGALVFTGLCAGLLLIPLNAALQHESDRTRLGTTIAIQNFVDYAAMLGGAGFLHLLTRFDLPPTQVFVALALTLLLLATALRMPGFARPLAA